MEIEVDRVEQLSDTNYLDCTSVRTKRFGKERKIIGHQIHKVPLGNEILSELHIYKSSGAGYQLTPYKVSKPLCDFINNDTYFYPEIVEVSDLYLPIPCPIPNVRLVT